MLNLTRFVLAAAASISITASCSSEKKAEPRVLVSEPALPARVRPAGLHPDDFRCQPASVLSATLGTDVVVEFSRFPAPEGVPRGCQVTSREPVKLSTDPDAGPPVPRSWTYDVDCRPTALRDGRSLLDQYAKHADSLEVAIGESAIDHRDVVLLFIDDDTPCYGRVMGPGRESRLALARLVAEKLDPKTAPARSTTYR